ncbi:MAG: hypothetical protein ACFFCW_43830, partial [Candidatus Hodarchaeota archaeon]
MGDYVIKFSFEDYQQILASNRCMSPMVYSPYMCINRAQYHDLEKKHEQNKNDVGAAFRELRQRVSKEYYWRIYRLQAHAMDYAQISFPAYRFILPEMLADDWLATVGWHRFNREHVIHQPLTAYVVQKLLKEKDDQNDFFKLIDG